MPLSYSHQRSFDNLVPQMFRPVQANAGESVQGEPEGGRNGQEVDELMQADTVDDGNEVLQIRPNPQ